MLTISKKGQLTPLSPIRKLAVYAERAKAQGKHIYHLNIGQPDIKTPELGLNVLKNYNNSVIEYTHSAGNISLRKGLVDYYKRINIDITEDNILVTTGGSEAITFALFSTLNEGDEVIIPEPFYANYLAFLTMAGASIKTVTTRIEDGFALPPIQEIEKLISPKTKGILITNPNNPTGYVYSLDELNMLADIAKKHSLYLYTDEVYHHFCYDDTKHHSLLNIKWIEDNVILFDSMSKTYSECGSRVGVLVSRNKNIIDTALKFAMARLCPPALGQMVAESSLEVSDKFFDEVSKEYTKRRDYLIERLNKMSGVICPKPKGAFYAIARLPIDNADRFAQWLLEEFSYNNASVMLAPASGFYHSKDLGLDEVRIAYVLNIHDLEKAMDILEEALKVYPNKKSI